MDMATTTIWPPPAFAAAADHRMTWARWVELQARVSQRPGQQTPTSHFDEREWARLAFLRWLYERDRLIA